MLKMWESVHNSIRVKRYSAVINVSEYPDHIQKCPSSSHPLSHPQAPTPPLPITTKNDQASTSPRTFNEAFDASKHIDRTRGTILALPRMAAEYELEQVAADAMAAEALFNNAARRYDLTVKKWQILTKLHVEEKIKEAKEEDEKL
jgi:hypothetical protein